MTQKISDDAIELSGLIKKIRHELVLAQQEGEASMAEDEQGGKKGLRFDVEELELEVNVMAQGTLEGGMAAKLWVLNSSFKASIDNAVTQKIRLKLKPSELEITKGGEKSKKPSLIGSTGK